MDYKISNSMSFIKVAYLKCIRQWVNYYILLTNIKKIVFLKYEIKRTQQKYSKEPVAVVYLARITDEVDIELVKKFAKSFIRYKVGVNYKLYIGYKDVKKSEYIRKIRYIFKELKINEIYLPPDGYDIQSYIRISKQISENKVIFFNTGTEMKTSNWLAKMLMNINKENFIIGGSGSYETLTPLIQNPPLFPNPHIRTNGFLIERKIFLNLTRGIRIKSKEDTWQFENGRNSLSAKLFENNGQVCIVDKFGIGYNFNRWPVSNTFRSSNQRNILFSDKQTREYAYSQLQYKNLLYLNAWGNKVCQ
jgi:hypothetical protein